MRLLGQLELPLGLSYGAYGGIRQVELGHKLFEGGGLVNEGLAVLNQLPLPEEGPLAIINGALEAADSVVCDRVVI